MKYYLQFTASNLVADNSCELECPNNERNQIHAAMFIVKMFIFLLITI